MYAFFGWLAAFVVFIVWEALTANLVSIWFIGGAAAAMIAALLNGPIWLQVVLFLAVSGILLISLRPLVVKYIRPRNTPTNADRNIGKTALVTEPIDNDCGKGAVRVGGLEWTARSTSGEKIEKDAFVTVKRIEGVKLYVQRRKEES